MTTAKKKTNKKKSATKKAVKSNSLDVDALREQLTDEITKKLTAEFDTRIQHAVRRAGQSSEQKRDRVSIVGGAHKYHIDASSDGLEFIKDDHTLFLVGKSGQLGAGTLAPRTAGKGSAHFKAGASSEAIMPTSGTGSTRGVIVEGDGDDDQTFVFRALSKTSRQGFNVFSDGAVGIGSFHKLGDAKLGVYHSQNDTDAVNFTVASKYFDHTVLKLDVAAPRSDRWTALQICSEPDSDSQTDLFCVSGSGSVHAHSSYFTNHSGYAEFFEWADRNSRQEERQGLAVALNDSGKLIVAGEGDTPIGVVVSDAAVTGNSAWNHWCRKHQKDHFRNTATRNVEIAEWLEDETTTLKSVYLDSLPAEMALPDNAVIYQTDSTGVGLASDSINRAYDPDQDYECRQHRTAWAAVCLLGTVPVYRGQPVDNRWITVKSINDELELMLIR